MTERTCPMVARASWDVASAQLRDSWHRLCRTQSPAGLKTSVTGAWLVFLTGCHRGEDLRLATGASTLGSDWGVDLVVTGPEVGSQHAIFTIGDGRGMVAPMAATRDVRVNGERIKGETVLFDGDLISFGEMHAVLRFAKAFAPGYKPHVRQRPVVVPTLAQDTRSYTMAWLVSTSGARYGQDWRLIHGKNRIGSGLNLEVCWLDNALPPEAAVIDCTLEKIGLTSVSSEVRAFVNDAAWSEGQVLQDSDRLKLNDVEFYLKCM